MTIKDIIVTGIARIVNTLYLPNGLISNGPLELKDDTGNTQVSLGNDGSLTINGYKLRIN